MKAMLLAAGRGTRMQPLTDRTPKPLLKVGGKALIVWHLERLAAAGFKEIVINHAWLGEQIEQMIGHGSKWGLNIQYSPETTALETAGGIAKALPLLGNQPFLVMNADVWCDWQPVNALVPFKRLQDNANLQAWLLLVDNPVFHPAGDFHLNASGFVDDDHSARLTFSGVGIYSPSLFQSLTLNEPNKLAPLLRAAMLKQQVIGEKYLGKWVDVGTPERLNTLNDFLT